MGPMGTQHEEENLKTILRNKMTNTSLGTLNFITAQYTNTTSGSFHRSNGVPSALNDSRH